MTLLEETGDLTAKAAPAENNMQLAYHHTREAILSGKLAPGTVLSQVQLSRELGVSRTPLREALRLLEVEGLVEVEAQKQIRIAGLHLDDLEELYAMRIMLESSAVKATVPHLSQPDFDYMHQALERFDFAVADSAFADVHGPHRDFHYRLFSHSGKRLRECVSDLWDHAERYRRFYQQSAESRLGMFCTATKEHAEILAAAEAGNANRCSTLIAEHLARTGLSVLTSQDKNRQSAQVTDALRMVIVGEAASRF